MGQHKPTETFLFLPVTLVSAPHPRLLSDPAGAELDPDSVSIQLEPVQLSDDLIRLSATDIGADMNEAIVFLGNNVSLDNRARRKTK